MDLRVWEGSLSVPVQRNAVLFASEEGKRNHLTNMTMHVDSVHFHLFGNGKFQIAKKSTLSFHPSFSERSSGLTEVAMKIYWNIRLWQMKTWPLWLRAVSTKCFWLENSFLPAVTQVSFVCLLVWGALPKMREAIQIGFGGSCSKPFNRKFSSRVPWLPWERVSWTTCWHSDIGEITHWPPFFAELWCILATLR